MTPLDLHRSRRPATFGIAGLLATLLLAANTSPVIAQDSLRIPLDRVVAVVNSQPILWTEVVEAINQRRAQGLQVPEDSAARSVLARRVLGELVDAEVLIQHAKTDTSIRVTEEELSSAVELQLKKVREQFQTEVQFRDALKSEGFGTPEEFRRFQIDQARRTAFREKYLDKQRQTGRLAPGAVSEADITRMYEENRATFPKRPALVGIRQIVFAPRPTQAARDAARTKAESLLVLLRAGEDFEKIARRESDDPASKELGGDLGWNRRGRMLPSFDRMMFSLPPGQISPLVETVYGYHIIRVDRVQPAEVKARHILISAKVDSSDGVLARALADSVLRLWASGGSYDTLLARHHDFGADESTVIPQFEREKLPETYSRALEGKKAGDFLGPFPIPNRIAGVDKWVIAQLTSESEAGEYTVADLRTQIRERLSQERAERRLLEALKKTMFVSILL